MGVYVFETPLNWIKVGHYKPTKARPHAYYRIAGRGFGALKHPVELDNLLGVQHLTLVAWYPTLGLEAEKHLHASCPERVGEFHPRNDLSRVLRACDGLGERKHVTSAQRKRAIAWGWARVRRAKRKRKRGGIA